MESGKKGFHLGISFHSFPSEIGKQKTKDLFPEAARKIAAFIRESIKEMKNSLTNQEQNFAEENKFPQTQDTWKCLRCNFRRICNLV